MDVSSVTSKFVAGGIAGVTETLITYPAEFAKTRRQLHYKSQGDVFTRATTKPPSSLGILFSTVQSQGIAGIYSGVQALAASNAAKSGIRFLAFESTRSYLDGLTGFDPSTNQGKPRKPWVNVVSGLSAGAIESILVVTPGEAIKTKMIHAASSHKNLSGVSRNDSSLVGAVSSLVRQEGVGGLWSGLTPVLCKQATNSAVRFTTFALLQERSAMWWPSMKGSMLSALVMGGISGIFTVYASMPFDNIKTRMQSMNANYKGMLDCASQILRQDGFSAFWRGTSPRLVRLTLSSGIAFSVYDQVAYQIKLLSSVAPKGIEHQT